MTEHVSRETPPAPPSARGVFADRLPLAATYAGLLATDGVIRGLIGPRETPRLWERHLLNCAVLSELVPARAAVCDVGSGAGLPGLVLGLLRPDLAVTLVEPLLRRTSFLSDAVTRLGLENVAVHRGRAETLHGTAQFDVVTSRAVAPLPRLLDWCMPLVRTGGELVAMKGSSATSEVEDASAEFAAWGVSDVEVVHLGTTVIDPPTTVIRARATEQTRLRWDSRRSGRRTPGSARRAP